MAKKVPKTYVIVVKVTQYKKTRVKYYLAHININKKHITSTMFREKPGGYKAYAYTEGIAGVWKYYSGRKKMMSDLLAFIKRSV